MNLAIDPGWFGILTKEHMYSKKDNVRPSFRKEARHNASARERGGSGYEEVQGYGSRKLEDWVHVVNK